MVQSAHCWFSQGKPNHNFTSINDVTSLVVVHRCCDPLLLVYAHDKVKEAIEQNLGIPAMEQRLFDGTEVLP